MEIPLDSLEEETEAFPKRLVQSRLEIRNEERARASRGTSWDLGPWEGLIYRPGVPGVRGPSSTGPGEPTA